MSTLSFTVGPVSSSSSENHNEVISGTPDQILIHRIKVEPSISGGTSRVTIYQSDAFTGNNIAYRSNAFSGDLIDPIEEDSSGNLTEREGGGDAIHYTDEDSTGELHIQITNNDSQSKSYDVTIEYSAIFDSVQTSNANTFTRGQKIDGSQDETQLTVQAAGTQNTDTFVVEDSSGNDWFTVNSSGSLSSTRGLTITGSESENQLKVVAYSAQATDTLVVENSSGTDFVTVNASGVTTFSRKAQVTGSEDEVQLTVTAFPGQTSNIVAIKNSSGDRVRVTSDGQITAFRRIFVDGSADEVQGTFQAFSGQSSNVFVVEESDGSDIFAITPSIVTVNRETRFSQSSSAASVPVIRLTQSDIDQPFIRFVGTASAGSISNSIVNSSGVSALVAGYVKVFIQDDGNEVTDQSYYFPVYTIS